MEMGTIRKEVTEKEIESGRIAFPAMARDRFLPDVAENSQTPVTLEDENGDTHEIVVKVRDNGTKPEIMAKGGKKLLRMRKISPGDSLLFLDEGPGDRIRLKVEKRPRLAPTLPPAGLGAFGFAHAPLVNEPPLPPPLPEIVVFGFDASIGSDDDHAPIVPSALENLVLGLGLSNGSESDNEPDELPNATEVELSLSIGSGHAPPIKPPPVLPPVVPEFGLSIGSGNSRLTLELGLSIGSDNLKSLEPPEAPPTALISFSAGKTIKRDVKDEPQEEVLSGPTLELTLGSLPWSAVLLQDHDQRTFERAVKPSLFDILKDLNVWAKPGSSTQQLEQELIPQHSAIFLGPAHSEAAYFPAAREIQEPKPPTALVPVITRSAELDFLGVFDSQSHVPPQPVPNNPSEAIVEDGPGRMLAELTLPVVVLGMEQQLAASFML